MVSQSSSHQDSPVDPLEGVNDDTSGTDSSPHLLDTDHPPGQSDIKLTRHRAAWINPQGMQPQDLPIQVPRVGNRDSCFVGNAASPFGTSPLCLKNSVVEKSLWKDAVGPMGSLGVQRPNSAFILTPARTTSLPGCCPWTSPFSSSKTPTASLCSEAVSACLQPPHLTASPSKGADLKVPGGSSSLNSSPEALLLPVDVEKENAHFHAADEIMSAVEATKWDLLQRRCTETCSLEGVGGPPGDHGGDSEGTSDTGREQESGSHPSLDSGCEGLGEFSSPTDSRGCSPSSSERVIYERNFNSAELIAKELYQGFRKRWASPDVMRQLAMSLSAAGSVVVNEEHTQEDFESSVDPGEEIEFKPQIRGTEDWTAPSFQVIFDVHPPLKRDRVVAAQNFFCPGCGTPIELNYFRFTQELQKSYRSPIDLHSTSPGNIMTPVSLLQLKNEHCCNPVKFVKRLRYCDYLGKYFCNGCHSHAESYIPARILTRWDFRKYPVSDFSKWLLDSIWQQPLFNLLDIGRSLHAKAEKLDSVREIQEQLFHIKKLLKTCRFAERALKALEQVPRHLTEELHLFSLEDLVRVRKGLLAPSLRDLLKVALDHVASCELCQGKGFICEFCRSPAVIFPFQTDRCTRCSECRACFHKQCFWGASGCPRCARITARKRLLDSSPSMAL